MRPGSLVASVLTIGLITVALAEIVLRLLDPAGITYFAATEEYFQLMRPDADYAYIHRPHLNTKIGDVPIVTNAEGLRGPDFQRSRPEDVARVLLLGDSLVFGWAVPEQASFSSLLRTALGAKEARKTELIAAGVGSWNTRSEFEYLRRVGLAFQPDLIVIVVVANDAQAHPAGRSDIPKSQLFPQGPPGVPDGLLRRWIRFAVARSYLLTHIKFLFRTRQAREEEERLDESSPEWADARLALDGITEIARSHGIGLIVYLYGSEQSIARSATLQLYRDRLLSRGIVPGTFPDMLFSDRAYRISVVDPHPTAAGHEIIASVMLPEIEAELAKRHVAGVMPP
jgi:lysophospholipase L1-like esterase